jgi:ribonuclease E
MSRQRIRPSLGDAHEEVCPRCGGLGHVRGVQSLGLAVLRLVEDEATKDRISQLVVQLPISVATFMLNEKRVQLEAIERRQNVKLLLIPNPHLDTPHFDIERIKDGSEVTEVSHHLMVTPEVEIPEAMKAKPVIEQAAVTGVSPAAPAPVAAAAQETPAAAVSKPSLLKRLLNVLTGKPVDSEDKKELEEKVEAESEDNSQREPNRRPRNNSRNNNRRGPRRRPEQAKPKEQDAEKKSEVENSDSKPKPQKPEDNEGGQNSNAKRSRRGGRRRRPRTDTDVVIPDDAGNKLLPEKKEVDGNAIPKVVEPEVNGNVVPQEQVPEVDGNKPPAEKKAANKPRRARTSTASNNRRRTAANKDGQEKVDSSAIADGGDKTPVSADNGDEKVAPKKRAPRKVKPKEDVSEPTI